ncbi:hypothetical protein, variant [Aphanomyces astaci]|uniref:Uncharacterized protein n=1 Tax=Aphanomyces astaci TaxID=112090 RepID=W4GDB4_APHAT|nr:hypothetical protein H257_08723 [Aphanomyces astaci]XP_009833058.1 hypothetical protein, variant [Aphanomyces astaci]ETV77270.1 hypothetical protein H257_08723 [Aphanomyces astaci]ETV77271.1 hypothetical protein, variant [Aphanomyces astaci]|eukprot:XP_009833057.1 hypothetical protein H257_08723 [Aphanomyces astaci]
MSCQRRGQRRCVLGNNVNDVNSNTYMYTAMLNAIMFTPVQVYFSDGPSFVQRITTFQWLSTTEEARCGGRWGLIWWQTQLKNFREPQEVDETIRITDALGRFTSTKTPRPIAGRISENADSGTTSCRGTWRASASCSARTRSSRCEISIGIRT